MPLTPRSLVCVQRSCRLLLERPETAVKFSRIEQLITCFGVQPWLREVGVAERRPVRTSRDVTSGRSSRPWHRKVLYFPHRRLWIMEYSFKERADVWWASLLRTRFEDGAIDVAWDEFVRLFRAKFIPEHVQDRMEQEFLSLTQGSMTVLEYEARFSELSKYAPHIVTDERRKTKKFVMGLKPSLRMRLVAFDHRTLDEALSAACRQEGEMEQYLEEKKASQKRPAATFQWQDKKKAVYSTQPRSVAVDSSQVPSVRSPSVKKECPHCGRTHGGSECWMITGKCLKCRSSNHKIKDCPRLQQGVQRGAPAPAVAAAAPATGRPGRPRAPARVFALAREDAEQAEHVTEGTVLLLGVHARVLFDTGATHSFISERFARQLALESGVESGDLEVPLSVHTPAGRHYLHLVSTHFSSGRHSPPLVSTLTPCQSHLRRGRRLRVWLFQRDSRPDGRLLPLNPAGFPPLPSSIPSKSFFSHSSLSILSYSIQSCFHGPQAGPSPWSKIQGYGKAHSSGRCSSF
ncbi:hypothetical protein Taro_001792 [Colocasia esculenta]|uniref:Retrotransposon gag domain-containing protein n=1 Tax=Colocasia esculenta TaxID=4460 RepID=A0A843TAZ8_COLES|nr:hypothetical protein [Colocasia esculenta]